MASSPDHPLHQRVHAHTPPLLPRKTAIARSIDSINDYNSSPHSYYWPHFPLQPQGDQLRHDLHLAYNAILVGLPLDTSQYSQSHTPYISHRNPGPFIPGALKKVKFTVAPLRLIKQIPHSAGNAPTGEVCRLTVSAPSATATEPTSIRIATPVPLGEGGQDESMANFDSNVAYMCRSASHPNIQQPMHSSPQISMERSASTPLDTTSVLRMSSYRSAYDINTDPRHSMHGRYQSIRGVTLHPLPLRISASLSAASDTLYAKALTDELLPGEKTREVATYHTVPLPPPVRRWCGTEIPVETIANNIDAILVKRQARERATSTLKRLRYTDTGRIKLGTLTKDSRNGYASTTTLPPASQIDKNDRAPQMSPCREAPSAPHHAHSVATVPPTAQVTGSKSAFKDPDNDQVVIAESSPALVVTTRSGRQSRTVVRSVASIQISPSNSDSEDSEAYIPGLDHARKKVKVTQLSNDGQSASTLHRRQRQSLSATIKNAQGDDALPLNVSLTPAANVRSSSNDLFPRRTFPKGRENSRPPPRSDSEPECMKHRYQPPRFAGDLYTPAIVRAGKSAGRGSAAGSAGSKEGWCGLCPPVNTQGVSDTNGDKKKGEIGGWLNLRNSSYRYHLIRQHGISPKTFLPFVEPRQTLKRDPHEEARVGEGSELKGQCGTCGKWIIFSLKDATNFYVHAAKCHREVAPNLEEDEAEEMGHTDTRDSGQGSSHIALPVELRRTRPIDGIRSSHMAPAGKENTPHPGMRVAKIYSHRKEGAAPSAFRPCSLQSGGRK